MGNKQNQQQQEGGEKEVIYVDVPVSAEEKARAEVGRGL